MEVSYQITYEVFRFYSEEENRNLSGNEKLDSALHDIHLGSKLEPSSHESNFIFSWNTRESMKQRRLHYLLQAIHKIQKGRPYDYSITRKLEISAHCLSWEGMKEICLIENIT